MLVSYLTNKTDEEFLTIEIAREVEEVDLHRGGCAVEGGAMSYVHHPSLPTNRILQTHQNGINARRREELLATCHIEIGGWKTHLTPVLIATDDATLYRVIISQ